MEAQVLDNIPVELDKDAIMKQLRGRREMEACVDELLARVRPIARPKALFKQSFIEAKGDNTVCIDSVTFASHVLRVNLDPVERVFPYVVTCGRELDEVKVPADDFLMPFCLDTIKRVALNEARVFLDDYLRRRYALGQLSRMAPGSFEDWPITQQSLLFSLLSNVEKLIGVTLTPDFLMVPVKSISGIMFPTEVKFESCQLCSRTNCAGRRAAYDHALVSKYEQAALH